MKSVLCLLVWTITQAGAEAQVGAGFEFQVNTYTTSEQAHGRVARLTDGRFVVVYDSVDQDGENDGVFARIYEAGGAGPSGPEFQINSFTAGPQSLPAVATLPAGEFVVVWQSFRQLSALSNHDLFGRRFDGTGAPVGTEFQINQYTTSEQTFANVAARSNGTFVVSWASEGQDGDDAGVFARLFELDGTPVGDEFQVNTYTTNAQTPARSGAPTVAWSDAGHFVVAWQSYQQNEPENSVRGQVFHASGVAEGSEFQISQTTTGNQASPAVDTTGDGFIAVWNDRRTGAQTYVRSYDEEGEDLTDETPVGDATSVSKPAISVEDSGIFTVAWTDTDSSSNGIVARTFDETMQPTSDVFAVNTYQTAAQVDPAVLVGPGEEFVVLWESVGQDGDQRGVFGQRFVGQGSCGDATSDETITASDALAILRTAVGSSTCLACVCDVNGSGITASDALTVLAFAVGRDVTLSCPAC
jgi:hypothetical protein